mmetsp:Transcript_22260/g.69087  ORF Transcript_22260/g.69087 Transcript_22260/m.69087 type:complete len:215 (-) Transcript_22260:1019-1663(-)
MHRNVVQHRVPVLGQPSGVAAVPQRQHDQRHVRHARRHVGDAGCDGGYTRTRASKTQQLGHVGQHLPARRRDARPNERACLLPRRGLREHRVRGAAAAQRWRQRWAAPTHHWTSAARGDVGEQRAVQRRARGRQREPTADQLAAVRVHCARQLHVRAARRRGLRGAKHGVPIRAHQRHGTVHEHHPAAHRGPPWSHRGAAQQHQRLGHRVRQTL